MAAERGKVLCVNKKGGKMAKKKKKKKDKTKKKKKKNKKKKYCDINVTPVQKPA